MGVYGAYLAVSVAVNFVDELVDEFETAVLHGEEFLDFLVGNCSRSVLREVRGCGRI